MNNHSQHIDYKAKYNKKLRDVGLLITSFFSTFYMRLLCSVKGIDLKGKILFFGKSYFYRTRNSQIVIGKNAVLRSDKYSNLIGINHPCIFSTHNSGSSIIIGDNCGFSGTVISAFISIKIGSNVKCGANTVITDSDWHSEDLRSTEPKPIEIKDNVWLGLNTIVLKGVIIGQNSIVGANSLVTSNIPPNVIAAGNPCKIIKNINQE